MYDIAIIGAGPAGISAAITARARDKRTLIISNKPQDSPLAKAKLVENYPGVAAVSGLQLLELMLSQSRELGVEFSYERVISVLPMGEHYALTTSKELFEARSVILATGTQQGKPYPGEAEFLGRGVSYCATCDGMLYKTATVCVVGLNSEAVEEANFLQGIGAKVCFISPKPTAGLQELSSDIQLVRGRPVEVQGDTLGVTALLVEDRQSGQTEAISCNGVFILRESIAHDALLAGLKLEDGYIATDAAMRTSVQGVFAAGDCCGKPLQIAKAAGEGQLACFSAVEYLG
jgi:thioredoxin reductase (NADPH)